MSPRSEIESRAGDLASGLSRFARTLTHDPALADDLVQETFVKALAAAEGFQGQSSVATWMHKILYHAAIDQLRRTRHEVALDEEHLSHIDTVWADDSYTVDPVAVAEITTDRQELEDALARLPFTYRSAVVLHDMVGWTSAEIAEEMHIGHPAAKQRLRRGRMMLVSALAAGTERRHALEGLTMRCWDARSLVSDYLDGQLSPTDRTAVEAHLVGCPTCPPLYAALVGTRDAVGALRDSDAVVPPALAERVQAVIAQS